MTRLPISDIRLDGGTQPRATLDFEAIDDYSEAMAAGVQFPSVTVFYDGEQYWLADGFHRVRAAYSANLDSIDCDVRQGTLEDAQWFSFGANSANGLRRSNDDKARAVRSALTHPRGTDLTDSEIARHCGVTQPTVAHWREKLGLSSKHLMIDSRAVTRDGKTYQQKIHSPGERQHTRKTNSKRKALNALIDAVFVISNCPIPAEDVAKHLISRQDRKQIISSMEKTREFLKFCAIETGNAGIAEGLGSQPHAASGADDGDPEDSARVAGEECLQQPATE